MWLHPASLSWGHFRKRIKNAVEHIVSQFPFVIEKVLRVQSALGLPLLSHDKGGEGLSRGTASAPSLLPAEHSAGERTERAQYRTQPLREGEREGRETLSHNGAAKETAQIVFPQIPNSAETEENEAAGTNKSIPCFHFKTRRGRLTIRLLQTQIQEEERGRTASGSISWLLRLFFGRIVAQRCVEETCVWQKTRAEAGRLWASRGLCCFPSVSLLLFLLINSPAEFLWDVHLQAALDSRVFVWSGGTQSAHATPAFLSNCRTLEWEV